jgi:CBS domain-containing protein
MISRDNEPQRWYYSEEDLQNLEYLEPDPPLQGRLHEMILDDPVSQLKPPKAIALQQDSSVLKAVELMKKFQYGSVLVFDGEELVGIFTEKDLLRTIDRNHELDEVALKDAMTANPQVLDESNQLAHALNLMAVGGYRHVPVMRDGKAAGFVSIRGILKYLAQNALR